MTIQQWTETRARTSAKDMDNWEAALHRNNGRKGGFHHAVAARGVVDFFSSPTSPSTFSER